MTSTVTRSQSNRAHLGCGGTGDSHHGCAADKYIYIYIYLLEIDRYIGLPIFFPIFKHFTIIGYQFWKKTITDFFFFVIHNYTEYNQQWNVFSVFDPSKCTHTWSSGHCSLRRSSSTTIACNFIQDSLVWNTLNYINIYYRTIISPINISIEINYLFYPQAITVWV